MESKKDEALIAKQNAEKRFVEKDFVGAKKSALKAQTLFPELDGISQMVATFKVYVASESKVNGEIDFYSILGLKSSDELSVIKKRYKRLAVLLHPDKNRTMGADGAFRLVSDAWTHLSDSAKRASYDLRRNGQLSSAVIVPDTSYPESYGKSPTFWTVCTSCQVQYEYLRKYVNKRLSCKNCRSTFMAVELGTAPIDGSYPVSQWSFIPDNGYATHTSHNGSLFPTNTVYVSGNSIPGYHSGHGPQYGSNVSFQFSTSPNGYTPSANGHAGKVGRKAKAVVDVKVNGSGEYKQRVGTKVTRPYKKTKVEVGENGCFDSKFPGANDSSSSRRPIPSIIDIRSLLIEKARNDIRKKLVMIKSENAVKPQGVDVPEKAEESRKTHLGPKKVGSVTLTVPDSDFHDFDKDRAEECFKPKQIWALYDEEDGMPRLYCLIRQVISVNPFKIMINYLGSKTDSEFGDVNWLCYGFTKSCGHFRAGNTDIIEQVNIFSHLLSREKAGRGGCVRLFPRSGEIWAIYRNWSPNWNRSTSYDVRHEYEMVEILDDYSEELGVWVAPLVKVQGFKTVYKRNADKDATRFIPKKEMVQFSHQVPSCSLRQISDLPDGCWDLDPAAIPEELLKPEKEVEVEEEN